MFFMTMIERVSTEGAITGTQCLQWWKILVSFLFAFFSFVAGIFFSEILLKDPGFHLREDQPKTYVGFEIISLFLWGGISIYFIIYFIRSLLYWKQIINRNKNFIVLSSLYFLTEFVCKMKIT